MVKMQQKGALGLLVCFPYFVAIAHRHQPAIEPNHNRSASRFSTFCFQGAPLLQDGVARPAEPAGLLVPGPDRACPRSPNARAATHHTAPTRCSCPTSVAPPLRDVASGAGRGFSCGMSRAAAGRRAAPGRARGRAAGQVRQAVAAARGPRGMPARGAQRSR
jgi:hypothetical protein